MTGDFNSKHEDIGHANSDDSGRTFKQPGTLQPRPTKTIKLYHKANWKHINNTITTQMANTTLNNKSTKKDIDKYINKLTDTITTTLAANITTKNIKENRIGLPKLITDMIKDKKYIRKKWQKTRIQYYKTL